MDIQDIRYILVLEQYRNFSEAAAMCNVSQSSFSKHIQKIEDELNGVKLFDRSARPLKVTAAGREFIAYAKQIAEEYAGLEKAMEKYSQRFQKELIIGTIPILGALDISNRIRTFSLSLEDGAKVVIRDLPNKELIHGLHSGALDVAFLIHPGRKPSGSDITYYKLRDYEYFLIVNQADPLSRLEIAEWKDLEGCHFISHDENTQTYELLKDAFLHHGLDWNNVSTLRNVSSIVESVEAGYGVAMLSEAVIKSYHTRNIKTVRMRDPLIYTLSIAYSVQARLKPLTKKFVDFLLESNMT